MSVIPAKFAAAREFVADRRAAAARRRVLEAELAAFSTPADRLEIETIVSRYPDEETREVRDILDRQSV